MRFIRVWPPWHVFIPSPPLQYRQRQQQQRTPSFIGFSRRKATIFIVIPTDFAIFLFSVQASLSRVSPTSTYFSIVFIKPFSSHSTTVSLLRNGSPPGPDFSAHSGVIYSYSYFVLFVFSNLFSVFSCGKKVGYLVPLDKNLEVDNSGLKIRLSEGPNSIGRSNVLVSEKRISRKHITLTTSTDGSAKLLVVAYAFPHLLPRFC